jgi:hypothetical protein
VPRCAQQALVGSVARLVGPRLPGAAANPAYPAEHRFWIDLVATFPFDAVIPAGTSKGINKTVRLIRMPRAFKVMRMLRVGRILKRVMRGTKVNPGIVRLFMLFGALLLMWHWLGCIYWYIALQELDDKANGDYPYPESNWLPDENQRDNAYPSAVFWAVTLTTGGNVNALTDVEVFFSIFTILAGVFINAFIIGSVGTALSDLDADEAERKKMLEQIYLYLRSRNVPTRMMTRIKDYYEYCWGTHLLAKDELFGTLHMGLKMELNLYLKRQLVTQVPAFLSLAPATTVELVDRLTTRIYLPLEFIVMAHEKGREMYSILRGKVEILHASEDPGRASITGSLEPSPLPSVYFREGQTFGEFAMFTQRR